MAYTFINKKVLVAIITCLLYWLPIFSQIKQTIYHTPENEYQFSKVVPIQQANGTFKNTTNYLWIPEHCKQIKAVIITSQNVLEQWLNEHPLIRKVCRENDIAILWSCPGFFVDIKDKQKQVNGKNIQTILDSLAQISGYNEVATAPWISIGHSGTNNLVSELIYHFPNKIVCAIKMKGGPGFDLPTTSFQMQDATGNSENYSIPVMCNAGEYFEWNQHKEDLIHPFDTIKNYLGILSERKQKQQPLSYFFDPNTGHFECSEALTKLVASYIGEAVKVRLRKGDGSLTPINLNDGWIAGLPLPGGELVLPKMYKDAIGDEKNCPWYFTKQQAQDAVALATADFKRQPQFAGFANTDGTPAGFNRGIVWPIPYTTAVDGVTFTLNPLFLKAIPDTFKYAGTPLSHSNNTPNVVLLCGNAKHIAGNTFRLAPERSYKAGATYFVIRTEGDKTFRTNIEPGQLVLMPNDKGMAQTIDFTMSDSAIWRNRPTILKATASSGMTVSFFVKSGPARIQDNQLVITDLPPRIKFPVKITVVAYQWGRSSEPKVQTANAVERVFTLYK